MPIEIDAAEGLSRELLATAARVLPGACLGQNPLPAAFLCRLADVPRRLAYCRENPYQLLTHWAPEREPEKLLRHEVQRESREWVEHYHAPELGDGPEELVKIGAFFRTRLRPGE